MSTASLVDPGLRAESLGVLIGIVSPAEIEEILRANGYETAAYRDASADFVHMRVDLARGRFVGGLWVHGPTSSSKLHGDLYAGPRTLLAGQVSLDDAIALVVELLGGFRRPGTVDAEFVFHEGRRPDGLSPEERLWLQLRMKLTSTQASLLVEAAKADAGYAAALGEDFNRIHEKRNSAGGPVSI